MLSLCDTVCRAYLTAANTLQINLKIFYPAIAYMIEYMRNITPHNHNMHPLPHPALSHKIIRSSPVVVRRGKPSDHPVHHTVTLGGPHEVRKSTTLETWWRSGLRMYGIAGCLKLLQHCSRELRIPELLVATCLSLLAEVYSTYLAFKEDSEKDSALSWKIRPCFRLEQGRSPIADFGISQGRVKARSNRLQTWTYYDPKDETRTMVSNPDHHYWIYFKTVSGQELTLDCCSYSFGMEACVDASLIVEKLPPSLCVPGCSRIPAYFRSSLDPVDKHPYDLIEEKRFSVMQNETLHRAIATDVYPENFPKDSEEIKIIRDFTETVTGQPCTETDMEILLWWRSHGSGILRLILSGRRWLEWDKPVIHSKNLYDNIEKNRAEILKGAKDPKIYVTGFSSDEEWEYGACLRFEVA